jgi:phosphopantothenoylcysteine decarboxylase/phosphopantothenate--cysteine ligase
MTAHEMHEAVLSRASQADAVIMAAAVADFTVTPVDQKLKKDSGVPNLSFQPTMDILRELVDARPTGQIIVGFAAETTNVAEHALAKLRAKGVDLLVVNDVSAPGAGFDHITNAVSILDRSEEVQNLPLSSKEAISEVILSRVASLLSQGAP